MANIASMTTIFENLYDINAAGNTMTGEIVGPPGCAKTSFANQFAHHMAKKLGLTFGVDFGYKVCHLSTEDPLDGPGVLTIGERDEQSGVKRAERCYPGLFPAPWEYPDGEVPEHGILVWDEYGQADHDQHKATATGVDERRLGNVRLPDGWMIILTSNRVQDRAGCAKPLTFITTRKVVVPMEFNSELLAHWLESKGVHYKLRAFVQAHPAVVQAEEVPDHDNPYSTSRTFYRACLQLMQFGVIDSIGTDEHMSPMAKLARETVTGTIGDGAAIRLFGHLRHCESMVEMDEIIKSPETAPVPERPDVMWAVVQMMASFAKEQAQMAGGGQSILPMFTYMKRMPENFQMSCVRMIAKVNKKLLMDKRYVAWVKDNRDLIMAAVAAENHARGR